MTPRGFFALGLVLAFMGGVGGFVRFASAQSVAECIAEGASMSEECFELVKAAEPSSAVCVGIPDVSCVPTNLFCVQIKIALLDLASQCEDANLTVASECKNGVGPGGCCIETVSEQTLIHGTCTNEVETCPDGKRTNYSCCYCERTVDGQAIQSLAADSRHTYESCEQLCKSPGYEGRIFRQLGAGALPAQKNAPSPNQIEARKAYCFTKSECISPDYGITAEAFRVDPSFGCKEGEGRCIAPEPEVTLSYPIGGVSTVRGYRSFISIVFQYMVGIVGVVAAVMFIWGGFRYIFGSAFENISRAKEIMVDAGIGLVLVFSAIAILRTINPNTLNLNKLEVFMINKSRILQSRFCADISEPADSTASLLFADAGPRPAYKAVGELKESDFTFKKEDTLCNYEYYLKGDSVGLRCAGRKCLESKQVCVSCRDPGFCPGEADTVDRSSYRCVNATWGGIISYSDERFAEEVMPLYVCKNFFTANGLPPPETGPFALDSAKVELGLNGEVVDTPFGPMIMDAKGGNKCKAGSMGYTFTIQEDDLQKAESKCENQGGVHGFVIGLQYNDPGTILCDSADNDEAAIIAKSDCNSAGRLSAYYEGGFLGSDTNDMLAALMCGTQTTGGKLQNGQGFWLFEEVANTVRGEEPKAIICNVDLNSANAISDPRTNVPGAPALVLDLGSGIIPGVSDEIRCPLNR